MLVHDFSNFADVLYDFAVGRIVADGVITHDVVSHEFGLPQPFGEAVAPRREENRHAVWEFWLRFGVGTESLAKAVLLKHEVPFLRKKGPPPPTADARKQGIHAWVKTTQLTASRNPWLAAEFMRHNINHPWEINSGTLGTVRRALVGLPPAKVQPAEVASLGEALDLLAYMRRNVDAHVYLKTQAGPICGDLEQIYLPALTLLDRIFHR